MKIGRPVLVAGITASIIVCVAVILALHFFGEQRVAFGSVMSFIATAVAAIAAVGYLLATFEMLVAVRSSAEEQARVAAIMEADLRYRIEPHLQFSILGGPTSDMPAVIENIGRGVAEDVTGAVTYLPTQRRQELLLPGWIEPEKARNIRVGQQPTETAYSVELSCTDSIRLNRYKFVLDPKGQITISRSPQSFKMPPSGK